MFGRRRRVEWRWERSPRHDLRMFSRGRPTDVVATAAWDPGDQAAPVIEGPDTWLVLEPYQLVVVERRPLPSTRLRIPVHSVLHVEASEEFGLNGVALVRITITAQLGAGTMTVPLWLPAEARAVLHNLLRRTGPPPGSPAPKPPVQGDLPPLTTVGVPEDGDWIVFRSGSDESLVVHREKGGPR